MGQIESPREERMANLASVERKVVVINTLEVATKAIIMYQLYL